MIDLPLFPHHSIIFSSYTFHCSYLLTPITPTCWLQCDHTYLFLAQSVNDETSYFVPFPTTHFTISYWFSSAQIFGSSPKFPLPNSPQHQTLHNEQVWSSGRVICPLSLSTATTSSFMVLQDNDNLYDRITTSFKDF